MRNDVLIELGGEELPPKALLELSEAFAQELLVALRQRKLRSLKHRVFATPRRLGLLIEGLDTVTPKEEISVWGPPKHLAFEQDGSLSKAGEAFCQRNNVQIHELESAVDGKAEKIFCRKVEGGESTQTLLPAMIEAALAKLPIAKRMRWGSNRFEFVRPVHWLVVMCDDKVVDCEIFGLKSGNTTFGHRFHCADPIVIDQPKHYEKRLESEGKVVANFDKRRDAIEQQVAVLANQLHATAVIDPDLLNEVTALVEWPVALSGKFDQRFLSVPSEALISSMKSHQKYFHLLDAQGALMPNFVAVANLESKNPAEVVAGNEKVIRPRLSDAAFFFESDKKVSLNARRERLKSLMFQAQLGSVFDKSERIKKLAEFIGKSANVPTGAIVRAAELCKCDLVSNMVYEFPEMQGIAGYHYALNDGEDTAVASAIVEHYLPRFAGDELPTGIAGVALALADRLDTVVGIFSIGQIPSGSKDPFALRRASISILRIIIDKKLDLDLFDLIDQAAQNFQLKERRKQITRDVLRYILDRLPATYENDNIAAETFSAVAAKNLTLPLDIDRRVRAVAKFSARAEAQSLAAANKRVANILAKLKEKPNGAIKKSLLREQAEITLAKTLESTEHEVKPLLLNKEYAAALDAMAKLKNPLDQFFDAVMVMCEENDLRENRLRLLSRVRNLFLEIADISLLAIAK